MSLRTIALSAFSALSLDTAAANAQISTTPRIGYLMDRTGPGDFDEAFLQGLREHGYVVGQNIAIEYRWSEGNAERLPQLAADLVCRKVDIIVTKGS
jgi:putative tryptophan/tyrosine transport system substrate-binding protein